MSGVTIIHLSDLHIGKRLQGVKEDIEFSEFASLTADQLVADFERIEKEKDISFRTEEVILIITGDITHQCKWQEYEYALDFIDKLRDKFSESFKSAEILPERIICIPGNHDLILPKEKPVKNVIDEVVREKYNSFKLFIEQLTNRSPFSINFNYKYPHINVRLASPIPIQIIDLNSCLHVNYQGASPYIIDDDIKYLDTLLWKKPSVYRIALMHHHLPDPSILPDAPRNTVHVDRFNRWLMDNAFKLLLRGHTHDSRDEYIEYADQRKILTILTTGQSFLQGKDQKLTNLYQVIRVQTAPRREISIQTRSYHWVGETLDREDSKWLIVKRYSKKRGFKPLEIASNDFCEYIGINNSEWNVIAHCQSGKFQSYGILSPGETINSSLLNITGKSKGVLKRISRTSKVQRKVFVDKKTLFLVDSPYYNPYVSYILKYYNIHLAGGSIEFIHNPERKPLEERIEAGYQKKFESNKEEHELFDYFTDYLLIMRLPGFIPSTAKSKFVIPDFSDEKIIWVIAGIHSKASYAGALLFKREFQQIFMQSLMNFCHGEIPEYFEAVYEIPDSIIRTEKFKDFQFLDDPVHFKVLRLKRDVAMSDDLPSNVSISFLNSRKSWNEIPIDIVHFDPVAGCNFYCSRCIEKQERDMNLYLSMDKCARILCDIKDAGCKRLNFYGGEPTLHPHFSTLLKLADNMGFEMLLVTNGSKLHKAKIKNTIISIKNNIRLRLSIDSHSPSTHIKSHGLHEKETHYFKEIVSSGLELIKKGVSVTVSILLHPHIINDLEKAVKFWKNARATALVIRPITEMTGTNPFLNYNMEYVKLIHQTLQSYEGFAMTPDWFSHWIDIKLNNNKSHKTIKPLNQYDKTYDKCYSAYYRIVIRPGGPYNEKQTNGTEKKAEPTETKDAWISLCSYRRCDNNYGLSYPEDFEKWVKKDRIESLEKIVPKDQCDNIICCRDGFNVQIDELVKESNLRKNR